MGTSTREILSACPHMAEQVRKQLPPSPEIPTKKPRAARFTGKHSQRKASSLLEESFAMAWRGPKLEREVRFHPTRKWRFDFAHLESKVAVEIMGGIYARGRHTTGSGFAKDREKMNAAVSLGWRVFELTPKDITQEKTYRMIEEAINRTKGSEQ